MGATVRIIGVLDLLGGRAVHARAGARERYAPVEHVAGASLEAGSAIGLARIYVDHLGVRDIYVADLDAIAGKPPQETLVEELASLGVPLWVDAGIRSLDGARRARDRGASHVVVGLETLPSFTALERICADVGREQVAFSLDLRAGAPIVMSGGAIAANQSVEALARNAVATGIGTLIAIDLARVGTSSGADIDLLGRLRAAAPAVPLVAGGGVREWHDLVQLADAGCDGALVATALHRGRIGAAEVMAARRLL